jgi:hypothetical protein
MPLSSSRLRLDHLPRARHALSGCLGEALCHEGDDGPQLHYFLAGGQPLVVAGSAAVCADAGEVAFGDPAAVQDLEGVGVAFADRFDSDPQAGIGPADQLPGVSGIGRYQPDVPAGAAQAPQQRSAAAGSWTQKGVTTTARIRPVMFDGDVPLSAAGLLRAVPAAGGPGHGVRRANGLGIDDRCGGHDVPFGGCADQVT